MNKTVNINLANILFHIDENAFNKMRRYLESVRRSFANTPGSDEILADIEARIAELFGEKLQDPRQVITSKEVDEVITIMGQPEDYMVDEDIFEDEPPFKSEAKRKRVKKLYRDTEMKYVAGVSSGLAHYVGIDPLWVRLLWILLTIGSGGGFILLYGLLWILIPEATTTSEKLDMRGEDINISNIERKVKEGFEDVANRVKGVDYDEVGNKVKNSGKTFFDTLGNIVMFFFKIIGKFIGIILVITGAATIIGLLIGLITVIIAGSAHIPGVDFYHVIDSSNMPVWLVSLLGFFAIAIPFFFLLYLGLKILVTNLKSIGNIAKFSLLGLWLISVIMLIVFGVRQAAAHSYESSVTDKYELAVEDSSIPVNIAMVSSTTNNRGNIHMGDMMLTHDENGNEVLVSKDIRLSIKRSKDSIFHLEVRKQADGSSFNNAMETAKRIDYGYTIDGNQILLNDYLTTEKENRFQDQEARVTLFIPEGVVLNYDNGDFRCWKVGAANDRDIDDCNIEDYTWMMGADGELKCQECPERRIDEEDDDERNKIRINEEGIDININDQDGESFKMKIDEDGVRIKAQDNDEERVDINIDADGNSIKIKAKDGDSSMTKSITKD
ncbi:PspC domain-containing protein [Aggregatimonas sangjinii]|uniref:PspC domain-containing protein n=1 Tax=Aggregatimonas sangjinii TaxID=2583587 RepID=A0A5B7SQC4_9FLAO|nr:PspC domain-containing protein [Aggregatimonas sangjinii]QCW99598.1 PspC domain-containing protein [Aggregatimonas sangjinii]